MRADIQTSSLIRRFVSAAFLLVAILGCLATQSFATRQERLVDTWKPVNYAVSLSLNDQLTEITSARVEITVVTLKNALSQIDLDFGEMPVDSVMVDKHASPYKRTPQLLTIQLEKPMPQGTSLLIAISYHGKPRDGLILGPDKAGKLAAVGDNWPNRAHHWIPCLDHPSAKATVSFSVTAPVNDIVVANGALTGVAQASPATKTWSYVESAPIPPYCMIIAVGDFAQLGPKVPEGPPLNYYVPQPDKEFAIQGFGPARPSLKFFTQTIAPYPYEKLALIVGATRFGGMENSSAIVFPSSLFDSRSVSDLSSVFQIRESLVEVIAHEIAHQWFGDSVTESTWSDLWLSEGFATYFAGLFIEHSEGEASFQRYMRRAAETALRYERKTRTPIHDTETEDLFTLLNANNYQKGAWVLHMLRAELGDEAFFRGIRLYYDAHRSSLADSEDLRAALEKASGKKLQKFFASWIYGTGHPRYELTWEWNSTAKKLRLTLRQLQTEPAFNNPLPIDIATASGNHRVILKPTGKQTIQELRLNEPPTQISIDSEHTVLQEATVVERHSGPQAVQRRERN